MRFIAILILALLPHAALAAPYVADYNVGAGTTNSSGQFTVDVPANAAGDLLIAFVQVEGSYPAPSPPLVWPAGWGFLRAQPYGGGAYVAVYFKHLAAAESDFTMTNHAGAQNEYNYVVLKITGHHATQSPAASPPSASVGSTAPDSSTLTPSWGSADNLWISFFEVFQADEPATGYPSGYVNNQITLTGGTSGLGLATKTTVAASDNPGPFSIATSRRWLALTVAVRPQ